MSESDKTPDNLPPFIINPSITRSSMKDGPDIKFVPDIKLKPFTLIGFNNPPPPNKLKIVSSIDQCGNFKQTFVPDTPIGRIWGHREISIDLIDDKKQKPCDNIAIGNIKPENGSNDPIGGKDITRTFAPTGMQLIIDDSSTPSKLSLLEKTNKMLTESVIVDERKEKIRLRLIKKLKSRSKLKPSDT